MKTKINFKISKEIDIFLTILRKIFCVHKWKMVGIDRIGVKHTCTRCNRNKHVRYKSSWHELKRKESEHY